MNARERLARISHHFLSEEEQCGATDAPLFFVAVPPVAPGDPPALALEALARAIARRGNTVAIMDDDGGGPCFFYPRTAPADHPGGSLWNTAGGDARRLLERAHAQYPPRIVLTTAPAPAAQPRDFAVTLIPLPADPGGMRGAFVHLKELACRGTCSPTVTGLTVCGALDPAQAGRCFDKLARAAQDFLSLTVRSYGWLPRNCGEDALGEVATLLLDDWRAWQNQRNAVPAEPAYAAPQHTHPEETYEPTTESHTADAR